MSTIKLELHVDANNIAIVTEFLGRIAVASVGGKKVADMKVVDAEKVEEEITAKPTPKPRPSRAKIKPTPEPEPEEDEEDEDDLDGEDDDLDDEDEEVTADSLRALQADKIDKHRAALKAQYVKLGATGLSSLDPKNYQKMYDFMTKLK